MRFNLPEKLGRRIVAATYRMRDTAFLSMRNRGNPAQGIPNVCIMCGPYRNLTTLTAATLDLHPQLRVLNHAGKRVFPRDSIDFIGNPDEARLFSFVQWALWASTWGGKGPLGGGIVSSHALDASHKNMRDLAMRHSESPGEDVEALVWKEPLRCMNHMADNEVSFAELLALHTGVRFLMPVRNVLDCSNSHLSHKHISLLRGLDKSINSELLDVARAILVEIRNVRRAQLDHPERVFIFHEFEIEKFIDEIEVFLGVRVSESWRDSARSAMVVKLKYGYEASTVRGFIELVNEIFEDDPQFAEELTEHALN